jgi:hypothetical protein
MSHPDSVVSPGGVGFDINCGVRLIRTNLMLEDVLGVKEELTQTLFNHIPVGVGSRSVAGVFFFLCLFFFAFFWFLLGSLGISDSSSLSLAPLLGFFFFPVLILA